MVLQFFKSSYSKVKSALSRARSLFGEKIKSLFQGKIDESTLEKLEQLLYEADFGVQTAMELTQKVRDLHPIHSPPTPAHFLASLQGHLVALLGKYPSGRIRSSSRSESPMVILIVGVNGNGKTTSVAKLAHLLQRKTRKKSL